VLADNKLNDLIFFDEYLLPHQILKLYHTTLIHNPSIVLASSKSVYVPYHPGPYSLKFVLSGHEKYFLGKRSYRVTHENFLLLNAGSEYATLIDSSHPSEILTLNFPSSFFNKIISGDPFYSDYNHSEDRGDLFTERLYTYTPTWNTLVKKLITDVHSKSNLHALSLQESMYDLGTQMLYTNRENYREALAIPLKKQSSRTEIYRRLYYIRDYIYSNFNQPIQLNTLCKVGMLSEFYMIKCYKHLFGVTPLEDLIRYRMQIAHQMITESHHTITEITHSVGYSGLTSFSKLYKKYFHYSPTAHRELYSKSISKNN
jgi:AraC family transcriptional regulator